MASSFSRIKKKKKKRRTGTRPQLSLLLSRARRAGALVGLLSHTSSRIMSFLASALSSSNMTSAPLSRGAARKNMSPASIAASRCCCSRRQFSSLPVACSSSSPGRRIVSLAASGKRSRSARVLLGRTSKSSVASAVANAPTSPTATTSFLTASAEKHAQDDDLELPSFDPSSGLVDLVIAGGGPSGLTVAERVSRAGENRG